MNSHQISTNISPVPNQNDNFSLPFQVKRSLLHTRAYAFATTCECSTAAQLTFTCTGRLTSAAAARPLNPGRQPAPLLMLPHAANCMMHSAPPPARRRAIMTAEDLDRRPTFWQAKHNQRGRRLLHEALSGLFKPTSIIAPGSRISKDALHAGAQARHPDPPDVPQGLTSNAAAPPRACKCWSLVLEPRFD